MIREVHGVFDEDLPVLSDTVSPPVVRGAAPLAAAAGEGVSVDQMIAALAGPFADDAAMLAAAFDTAVLAFLSARRDLGLALQHDVLTSCRVFRVAGGRPDRGRARLRLLAFAAPGDLQMNMPIEFITEHLDVRLDILFVAPDQPLPPVVPDHDLAICVISDSDPDALMRLAPLLARWPRPVLNHPGRLADGRIEDLTRDGIARLFASEQGITAPATVCRTRDEILAALDGASTMAEMLPQGGWPVLVRPVGSHAGRLLERLHGADELLVYVRSLPAERFYLSRFIDYRDADGLYRKRRVALIQGEPFLCHMAISSHWMIHYLNAGMTESPTKRADEAAAMAEFDHGFARRHRRAFATLTARLGLDYVILDCAEAPDGSLLLFEVEMAAIIHLLDPVAMFPYKLPQMQRVFAAFDTMLRRAAGWPPAETVRRQAG